MLQALEMAASLAPINELHVCRMAVKRVPDLPEVEAFPEGLQPHQMAAVICLSAICLILYLEFSA